MPCWISLWWNLPHSTSWTWPFYWWHPLVGYFLYFMQMSLHELFRWALGNLALTSLRPIPFLFNCQDFCSISLLWIFLQSSVCAKIVQLLGQNEVDHRQKQVVILSQDSFYRVLTAEQKAKALRGQFNFDHPGECPWRLERERRSKTMSAEP